MMNSMFAEKVADRIELPEGYTVSSASHNGQYQISFKDDENAFKVMFDRDSLFLPQIDTQFRCALRYEDYSHLIEFSQQALDIAKRFIKEYKRIEEAFDQL